MVKLIVGGKKEEELNLIKSNTIDMFNQIEKMLELSKILLDTNDNTLALELIEEDRYTDDLQNDLIVEINNFIVIEQPKAIDLRMVLGTYQLIGDLERIGDYCKGFAKTLIKTDIDEKKHQNLILKIFDILLSRLKEVQIAYAKVDHTMAKMIAKRDEEIDTLSKNLIKDLTEKLAETTDVTEIKSLIRVITLAKQFDRAGDHLVNICEQISYISKGQIYHYA